MEIEKVAFEKYISVIDKPLTVFSSGVFAVLNKLKVDDLHFFLFKDTKYRFGIILGQREKNLYSPFSAPFGGFDSIFDNFRISQFEEVLDCLNNWILKNNVGSINITIPPTFYDSSNLSKQVNTFIRKGYLIKNIDLNYSFELENFNQEYNQNIWRNARKNLVVAMKNEFEFFKCQNKSEFEMAYDVIKTNRDERGYPLRMSLNQLNDTSDIINIDSFLCFYKNQPVSSAIVFNIRKDIVMVVYWGDISQYSSLKPMNFLSYKIFEFYKNKGIKHIDIGPSTENSIPNYGLCEFKESIGCSISQKLSFQKTFK